MKLKFFFLLIPFTLSHLHALEIDEKLTLRFLKVSSTKKTVLINRGGEDGLVVGDHAKFFITAGVIARGVVEKVSPSRSVWSLYRVVDPTEIVEDKVLNLKISSPVKITSDPTKSLKEEPIPGGTEVMNTTDGEAEGEENLNELNEVSPNEEGMVDDELSARDMETPKKSVKTLSSSKKNLKKVPAKNYEESVVETETYSTNTSKPWEVWGTLQMNSLSGTFQSTSDTSTSSSTSASSTALDFSIGIERYFFTFNNFLKEASVFAFIHKNTLESGDSLKSKTDYFEYGGGLNYHFYNKSSAVNRLIGFGTLTFGQGSASIESKVTTNGVSDQITKEGNNGFFSVGVGAKYALSNGFGIKSVLDYYRSSETYTFENYEETRVLSGPRIQFGLLYRF